MADPVDLRGRPARATQASPLRVVAAILLASITGAAAAGEPTLRLDPDFGAVEAAGLDAGLVDRLAGRILSADDWRAVFAVYTGDELPGDDRPAVAGSWAVEDGVVRFRPRFPFVPGLTYVARLDLAAIAGMEAGGTAAIDTVPIVARFTLPRQEVAPSTVVAEVHPTASEVPENLLRLYLHFSAPMSRGEAYEHIRLLDAAGAAVAAPFLEIAEELWDPGMRRLTLFFDPGRIKRGLRPHLEAGPPLRQGESYRLVIDADWRDAKGLPLAAGFEKAFTVTAPDRRAPDPADWRLTAPAAGSRDPLELAFPEPLDHGLLERVVRVRGDGEPVAGEIAIGDGERSFRFTPDESWRPGGYAVEVETILEDLAGNNLSQVFDVDLSATAPSTALGETVSIPFTVGSRG